MNIEDRIDKICNYIILYLVLPVAAVGTIFVLVGMAAVLCLGLGCLL